MHEQTAEDSCFGLPLPDAITHDVVESHIRYLDIVTRRKRGTPYQLNEIDAIKYPYLSDLLASRVPIDVPTVPVQYQVLGEPISSPTGTSELGGWRWLVDRSKPIHTSQSATRLLVEEDSHLKVVDVYSRPEPIGTFLWLEAGYGGRRANYLPMTEFSRTCTLLQYLSHTKARVLGSLPFSASFQQQVGPIRG